jgi:hypothetical protein
MKKFNDQGSMVIEAAIVMPFFLAFVIAMISFVQIAVTDMALQSSVSETTKQLSAHIYPIYLMNQSETGMMLQSVTSPINHAREEFASAETFSDDYSALIPESIVSVLNVHDLDGLVDELLKPGINKAVLSLFQMYVDEKLLDKKRLSVVEAILPNLNNKNHAFFGFTAEYKLKLFIPFMSKEIRIRKTSYERVWIGD